MTQVSAKKNVHSNVPESLTDQETGSQPVTSLLPNGEASAAILASGIGCAIYGLIVLVSEAQHSVAEALILNSDVGPLSGKSTFGVIAWLVVWGALHMMWRQKRISFPPVYQATLALVGLSLLMTFPPFFLLFSGE